MKQNENTLKSVLCSAIRKDFLLFGGGGGAERQQQVWIRLLWTNEAVSSWTSLFPLYITEANEWQQRKAATLSWVNEDILGERIFQGAGFCLTSVAWKTR